MKSLVPANWLPVPRFANPFLVLHRRKTRTIRDMSHHVERKRQTNPS